MSYYRKFQRLKQQRDKLSEKWWDTYRAYLKSNGWKFKRNAVIKRDGEKCTKCGARYRLQVHHKTYDRVGKEQLKDLITLCWACHEKEHKHSPLKSQKGKISKNGITTKWQRYLGGVL